MPVPDRPVALVGCGYTELTKAPAQPETALAVRACRAAAEDAGLDPADLDGINVQVHHYPPPRTGEIIRGIGMREVRWQVDGGLGIGSLARAAEVVAAGECDHLVVCKVMNTIAPVNTPDIDPETGRVPGPAQFEVPYGLGYTMQRFGLPVRRWMHRYGITAEQIGWLAVVEREHAMLTDQAYFQTPLTLEEYLASPWIADPVRRHDCDYPVNGAYAYVVTRADRSADLRHRPVHLRSWVDVGLVRPGRDCHQLPEEPEEAPSPWLAPVFSDAGVGPDQLDLWMLYDGFSFCTPQWMESLGLVPRGESGAYIEGGDRIRFDGLTPVNTHGGQLSEGRMHGAGHILETIRQLRGDAGTRQVEGVRHAVVSTAFTAAGAVAILGVDD